MIIFLAVISFLYVFLLLFLLYGLRKLPDFCGKNSVPKTTFSILIPFRNEAESLPELLYSLKQLNYPKEFFEIILINDASEDASEAICTSFISENPQLNVSFLQNQRKSGSPKKDALTTGIEAAKNDFIATTDADCRLPETWLQELDAVIQNDEAEFVAGPVTVIPKKGFWNGFQELDIFSLQAATMGSFGVDLPIMCNGANLCFSKEAFLKVNGYSGNEGIASGDDIFLLEKFQKAGLKTAFLKSRAAIVQTTLQPDLESLISQRVRWAAKTSAYKSFFAKIVGLTVLLMNLGLIMAFLGFVTGLLPLQAFGLPFLLKFNADFILIYQGARFFDREKAMKTYFFSSLIYPFFSSYVTAISLFCGYNWKGRRFRK
ncbi:Glycosyltransferase, catalytic subunit of cellulose synthase and poly-beta-1,6-N-acetylglucosamine synthase [Salinimicrobium catena]|uniref:Glycosyltransferase, catalytic subunit of cellulose synthase and poly-beta-1,6-N-acetylglucosamine synthase n=1 Tax=Salinimicrobium catena TaxID=390640 RepID=A0A1H5JSC3_9FLAO|nr:glycosyltransferase [Salinimicrobium catena]SDK89500.1 Glycosyltransferase, catalytic subunit of cellulose synthase and poly-beta-1,6-N-acetylglucosamine synthase [Salinimicrobium catena]SEE54861.1 Glycosyltransferase, catalytic subunit of cellulose synthase and poly-beta-1,6-N-acetylglucosamine synthase [Salinimicrobium catena]